MSNDRQINLAVFLMIGIVFMSVLINHLLWQEARSRCENSCFPNRFDLLDTETCACWLPNGRLLVLDQ